MQIMAAQLSLFQEIDSETVLESPDSPKCAFYRLRIESDNGIFIVRKESGAGGIVLDRRAWVFNDIKLSEKFYVRIIREKTNPDRKSPRVYVRRHHE